MSSAPRRGRQLSTRSDAKPRYPARSTSATTTTTSRSTRRRQLSSRPEIQPNNTPCELKTEVFPSTIATRDPSTFPTDDSGRVYLKDLNLPELEQWVSESLGEKKFRARQLWKWLYKQDRLSGTFEEMTDLSKAFREMLPSRAALDSISVSHIHESNDGTKKILYAMRSDNKVVEAVIIPTENRTTLCISSQAGCGLNCQFCMTGKSGFKRHLTTTEIVDQVILARRYFQRNISHIVFMGEGEPFHNYPNVIRAIEILLQKDGLNFSHNKVTVSTSGLVPEIEQLLNHPSNVNLAVSLHACNDKLRNWIMPINRKYPLHQLMNVLETEFNKERKRSQQRKVFFEYVMLKDVNDSVENAKQLLQITSGIPCKVNLIHFNPHPGTIFEPSSNATIYAFQDYLVKKGMTVTVRSSRGGDQMAACGQLGKVAEGKGPAPRMRIPEEFAGVVKQSSSV